MKDNEYEYIKEKIIGQIDADKARETTNESSLNLVIKCLDKIYDEINRRAKYGYSNLSWNTQVVRDCTGYSVPDDILRKTIDYLKKNGYMVQELGGGEILIKW